MEKPAHDPYVICNDGDRYWHVYIRTAGETQMELDTVTYANRNRNRKVTGSFLDLTELFEKQGFKRIRARKSFFNGGTWLGAEWWHFQYEKGLIAGQSTFGGELLKVYSEETLMSTPPWQYRNHVFKINWG